jgi:DNA-binding MarR family transcriptional regulator
MSATPSPGSIVLLTRLSRLVYKRATEDVLGMRLKEYMTLSNLRDGPVAQQDLCASMHLDPNNCVLLLNDLEAAGHVERRRDPADRRRHIVEITPGGRKALVRVEHAMESLEDQVLGALSPEERGMLRELLGRALADAPAAQPIAS